MSILRRITALIIFIAVGLVAIYFFLWVIVLLAILVPVGLIWLRWRMKKAQAPKAKFIRIETIRKD